MQKLEYEVHSAAAIFPMMTEAEFVEFKEDIAQHGVREPIVLLDGKLIDGRNRLRACNELGMESELTDDVDPVAYIMSANLHRRHLSESQRGVCAAKLATLNHGGDRKSDNIKAPDGACSIDDAAALFQVGARSVDRAKKVMSSGSKDVVEAVERGDISVSLAAKLIAEVPDKREQSKLVKEGAKAIRDYLRPPPPPDTKREPKESPKQETDNELAEFRDLWNRCTKTQKTAIRAMVLSEDI